MEIVKQKMKNPSTVAEYEYDALGRRCRTTIDSTAVTDYYYNAGWQVLEEYDYDAGETFARRFVYGNYIDEPLYMYDGTNTYYYGHDHLYNVSALINTAGDVAEYYEYDAYGKMTAITAKGNGTWWDGDETKLTYSAVGNPYYYTGRRLDNIDSGSKKIQYSRWRYYSPDMGRFLTEDPQGMILGPAKANRFSVRRHYLDGMNLYSYANDNSVANMDAFGLFSIGDPGMTEPPDMRGFQLPEPKCGKWKNNGVAKSTGFYESGCRDVDVLEGIGVIFEFVGGVPAVIVGIAGQLMSVPVPLCDLRLLEGWVGPMSPCRCKSYYKRKCTRSCKVACNVSRNERTNLKMSTTVFGYARKLEYTRNKYYCQCDDPQEFHRMGGWQNAVNARLDCNKLNK